MNEADYDSDDVHTVLGPVPDCGICGREMGRWSHQHPNMLVCLNCDRVAGMVTDTDWTALVGGDDE
jgi:hypothetical protein